AWTAQNTMSYLPGGPPLLADGYIQDWPRLLAALQSDHPAAARLRQRMSADTRRLVVNLPTAQAPSPPHRSAIIRGLNDSIVDPTLYDPPAFADLLDAPPPAALLPPGASPQQTQQLNRMLLQRLADGA